MKIALIGSGYVGSRLAALFRSQGHEVAMTTTTPAKYSALSKIADTVYLIEGFTLNMMQSIIEKNDVLIVTVAPKDRSQYESTYLQTARQLLEAAKGKTPKQLIYTSSTSVYKENQGKLVIEESPLVSDASHAQILIETEKTYLELEKLGWNVCIFRLSEIYGPQRSLSDKVKKYSGKVISGNGNNPSNMIHVADVVHAISYSVDKQLCGVYNLSDDDHRSRMELYGHIANLLSLSPILWEEKAPSLHGGNKIISNQKIKSQGYRFLYSHRQISESSDTTY